MSKQSAVDVFDMQTFIEDCERYRQRRNWTRVEMALHVDCSLSTLKWILDGQRPPGLRLVVLMANTCDLSLDKYRIEASDG